MLTGVRVIDFSQYIPGSYTSKRLSKLGAEVIKIEPLTGDPTRNFARKDQDKGIVFAANNTGKKSVALNLKEARGQTIALEMIKKSDIVIEGFRPEVMSRFGLNYAQVVEQKEDIIYCSISGYGKSAAFADFGSHDLNYQALGGVLSKLKDGRGRPILSKLTLADIVGGMDASEKIIGALFHRERTGKGQYLQISLLASILSMMDTNVLANQKVGADNVIPQLEGNLISYNIYETKDGRFVSLAALEPKFWQNFCYSVGREEWIPAHKSTNREQEKVYLQLVELFMSKTLTEWHKLSLEVDCCLTPVLEISEIAQHPFVLEKELFTDLKSGPILGEHTELILSELLSLSAEELAYLSENNIIKIG